MKELRQLGGNSRLTRRHALAWLGGLGLAAVIPGCGGGNRSSSPSTSSSASTGATSTASSADCVLMPELTEGPYYLDLDLVRKDITGGKPGLPLSLRVNVVKVGKSCSPIEDAAVDIWHADAAGEYSGVQGVSGNFLRGIQMTDASGKAEFETIYPGWYMGRAVHIHVKVHVGSSEVHTGQLFFDDDRTDAVYKTDPYSRRPNRDTLNSSDSIFAQSQGTTIVAVTPGAERYSGAVTLGVQ
ncbi:MAG TPA: intradiol ring-cleavage dioxygenase [Gaiellaceae bacterium]|jgi:protocatechuate 3,4-dioxygenase beta subunit